MGLVTLSYNLTAGTLARAAEVMANFNAILTQAVNGNLTDTNIANGAAINGNKLSNVALSRVPEDRIEDDAITADKLRDDLVNDAQRAVTTNHIRNLAVTKAKLSTVGGNKITIAQLEMTPLSAAVGPIANQGRVAGSASFGSVLVYGAFSATPETVGANWHIRLTGTWKDTDSVYFTSSVINPNAIGWGNFPTATWRMLSVQFLPTAIGAGTISGTLTIYPIWLL